MMSKPYSAPPAIARSTRTAAMPIPRAISATPLSSRAGQRDELANRRERRVARGADVLNARHMAARHDDHVGRPLHLEQAADELRALLENRRKESFGLGDDDDRRRHMRADEARWIGVEPLVEVRKRLDLR